MFMLDLETKIIVKPHRFNHKNPGPIIESNIKPMKNQRSCKYKLKKCYTIHMLQWLVFIVLLSPLIMFDVIALRFCICTRAQWGMDGRWVCNSKKFRYFITFFILKKRPRGIFYREHHRNGGIRLRGGRINGRLKLEGRHKK